MRPQRQQPTRLPHPWDSPGNNTGVGCHFLRQCLKVKSESEDSQSYLTLSDPMDCSLPGSSVHGIFQARVLEWGTIAFSHKIHLKYIKKNKFPLVYCSAAPIRACTIGFSHSQYLINVHFASGCGKAMHPKLQKILKHNIYEKKI